MPRYWLFKSEPECFSYEALEKAPNRRTGWDGVRNYQARNFLRDDVKYGDGVIYYHSNAEPPGIAGIAVVVEEAHPDPTQFDPKQDHYDPKSDPNAPTWVQVSVEAVAPVNPEVGLPAMRKNPTLEGLELLRTGSRLSVHPVSEAHWKEMLKMAGFSEDPHAKWLQKHGLDTGKPSKASNTAASKPGKTKPAELKSTVKSAVLSAKAKPKAAKLSKPAKPKIPAAKPKLAASTAAKSKPVSPPAKKSATAAKKTKTGGK